MDIMFSSVLMIMALNYQGLNTSSLSIIEYKWRHF